MMRPNSVLSYYFADRPADCERVQSSLAFSGASVWRVNVADEPYCLRCWPEGTTSRRVRSIQHAVHWAAERGIDFLATPVLTLAGESLVERNDHVWELTTWLPGEAAAEPVSTAKIEAAAVALAKLHLVWRDFVPSDHHDFRLVNPFRSSHAKLTWWRDDGWSRVRNESSRTSGSWLVGIRERLAVLFERRYVALEGQIAGAASTSFPTQLCLRDVWRPHVLFTDDRVTGLIDYDAMQPCGVFADMGRLLRSLAGADETQFALGLAAYESTRPLTSLERELLRVYDRAAQLLAPLQWLEWMWLDGLAFPNMLAVAHHLEQLVTRAERLDAATEVDPVFPLNLQ